MAVHSRVFLALLAVAVLGLSLIPGWGVFDNRAARWGGLAALVLALAASCGRDRVWRGSARLARLAVAAAAALLVVQGTLVIFLQPFKVETPVWMKVLVAVVAVAVAVATARRQLACLTTTLVAAVTLVLAGNGAFFAAVLSDEAKPVPVQVMHAAACVGFVTVASLFLHLGAPEVKWRRWFAVQLLALFAAGAIVRLSAVLAVPEPGIDVYVILRDSTHFLGQGYNPYTTKPPDIDYWPYAAYPPLPLLMCLPFEAVGLDVRYANVVCDLLAAVVLVWAGWRRGCPLTGALAAGAYLHFPRAPFMIEQAWYEPMLAALLGGGLLLAESGRRVGSLLLGLGLTGKQYGLAMLPPVLMARRGQWRAVLLGVGVAVAAVLLPFFLWDPKAFLDVVLFKHLDWPIRPDAMTLHTWALYELGWGLPRSLPWALAALLLGWITWRTPATGTGAGLWVGTALFAFVFCHTQGFYNYFYLCEYLLLLGIAGLAVPAQEEPGPGAGIK